jgi:hypothetical protein
MRKGVTHIIVSEKGRGIYEIQEGDYDQWTCSIAKPTGEAKSGQGGEEGAQD